MTELSLPVLQLAAWRQIPQLAHGFFTRRGGASIGPHAELNLSFKVSDSPASVEENWRRVRAHTGGRLQLVTMNQVHGTTVAEIGAAAASPGDADAMVTAARGVGLCVLTADCVPIFLVSPEERVVAAVHAGWRGTLGGVAVAALRYMNDKLGVRSDKTLVATGPTIGACCYEVDASIVDDIEVRWGAMSSCIRRYERDGVPKARVDLRAANAKLLVDAGVDPQAISHVGGCTACGAGELFSYRVASRSAGTVTTGRQLSFIGWAL